MKTTSPRKDQNKASTSAPLQRRTGRELYRIDGESGTLTLIADINPGPESSDPADFTEFRGDLYFRATAAGTGRELYRLDGETGTLALIDINPGVKELNCPRVYRVRRRSLLPGLCGGDRTRTLSA